MSHRDTLLLIVICKAAFVACNQSTASPKEITHNATKNINKSPVREEAVAQKKRKPEQEKKRLDCITHNATKSINKSLTREETIAQKKRELEQVKEALGCIKLRLINLSQCLNNTAENEQTNEPSTRSNTRRISTQHVTPQTLEEVQHNNNGGYVSDDASIQSPPDILRKNSEIIEEEAINDFSLSLERCVEKARNVLDTSLEEFEEQAKSSLPPKALEETQQDDDNKREQNVVSIQTPYTAFMSDEVLQNSDSTWLSFNFTALQAEEANLGELMKQLEKELNLLSR